MQTGGRLVEEVERAGLRRPTQLVGEFDALGFATREGVAGLAQRQVAQPGIVENVQGASNARHTGEKFYRFGDREG